MIFLYQREVWNPEEKRAEKGKKNGVRYKTRTCDLIRVKDAF